MKKNYELKTSTNYMYIAGVCRKNKMDNRYEIKIWDSNNMIEISSFYVDVDLGGSRYAISNDGNYVATAQYEEYKNGMVYIYDVQSGENIFKYQLYKQIQWLIFADNTTIMIGTEKGELFKINITSGICEGKIKGKKIYNNDFGDNIILLDDNIIKYKGITHKSSTFAYLCATGTPKGILVSEVNSDLYYYDCDGNILWKTDLLDIGHFIDIYYNSKDNMIYGILFNPRKKGDERMHFVIIDELNGNALSVNSIETADYVFVRYHEIISLVNGKGSIYIINDDGLQNCFIYQ